MRDEKENPEFMEKLYGWLREDGFALQLCNDLLYIAHLWDDLIDKDKVRTDEEINAAFLKALGVIPLNPFYQAHIAFLAPLVHSVAIQYQIANILERGTDGEKRTAFAMRNALLEVIGYCIHIKGGDEWYMTAGLEFHQEVSKGMESLFQEYMKEMEVVNA